MEIGIRKEAGKEAAEKKDAVPYTKREGRLKQAVAKKQLFLNYKGGTGKTSISFGYGSYLALKGKKVLMMDLDAQAHLTTCLNQEAITRDRGLYSIIVNEDDISKIITKTATPGLHLIPSSISISALEMPLFRMPFREFRLRLALKAVEKDYDYIVIDSAPSINLLGLNAILASDEVLIPLMADFLSFHGLKTLLETLASIEKDFHYYLDRICIFLNRYREEYNICRECKEAVSRFYPGYSLNTVINESYEIIESSGAGKSVFELFPESKAAEDIKSLVNEVNGFK